MAITLRNAIETAELSKVYELIDKHLPPLDGSSIEDITETFKPVIDELLSKPKTKAYHMPILVENGNDTFTNESSVNVYLLNRKYVQPPIEEDYNVDLVKYKRVFPLAGVPWSSLIDTTVLNNGKFSLEGVVAAILMELISHGWSEEDSNLRYNEMLKKENAAMEIVKSLKIKPK